MTAYDLVVKNARVVTHDHDDARPADIAVNGGRIASVASDIAAEGARRVVDADGRLAFPGVVDAHQHWGIYNPLPRTPATESRACAQGGVTTALTYMRTGQYYLNKGGAVREFFPEVLRGRRPAYIDYALPPRADDSREHIDEIPDLIERVRRHLVQDLHVLRRPRPARPLGRPELVPDDSRGRALRLRALRVRHARRAGGPGAVPRPRRRDLAVAALRDRRDHDAPTPSWSRRTADLSGLAAYSASRPPHSEGLAVTIASYLAHETGLPNINLLHLSSRKAVDAAVRMARAFPHIDFRREVTDRPSAGRHRHRARPRRQGQPAAAAARGRRGAVGARARRRPSTGSSATTPAAGTRLKFGEPDATTSSSPSPASAAPSTCCPAWSPRAASAACRSAGSPS